ncbi:MAG TPA: A/G-specific adenine glycosylase [Firmicutes bacterium]|nr:A/G-specific adenine glycosylase [Bacillota bacterium]
MELEKIVTPLLHWFGENARLLPWRDEPTAYRVWVSEIMLQQTRVETVKPYFERFLTALPDVKALAEVPQDILLKLWEGLGYYNRVRNMQKCAQEVMARYDGRFPADYQALLSLPGIGPYTAGAVASIAFGLPVPAVDGNVLRVITRLTANGADITKEAVKKEITSQVAAILPHPMTGAFNQSLMELGAIICLPNGTPLCSQCPLEMLCEARRQGNMLHYPVKGAKKPRRQEERMVFLLFCGDQVALCKRPDKGLLAGLWEFPQQEGTDVAEALTSLGYEGTTVYRLPQAKHIFTHIEWHMTGYGGIVPHKLPSFTWVSAQQLQKEYPLPSAFRVYRQEALRQLEGIAFLGRA